MARSVESRLSVESSFVVSSGEKAQDLFDSAVAIHESTRRRVQLITHKNGAKFLLGERSLREKKPPRALK